MGITSAFYIAIRGLTMAQTGMEVVSHNIANVDTEGYSRQELNLITPLPAPSRWGPLGTGVDAASIGRAFDQFIQKNLVEKSSVLAKFEAQKLDIDAIENIFNDSAGNHINEALSEFWNAWQDLANNPEGNPERANLLEKADTLAQAISTARQDLDQVRAAINTKVVQAIDEANTLIAEIAEINQKIISEEAGNLHNANDLRDMREEHLKALSNILDIQYYEDPQNNAVSVLTAKGTPLVSDTTAWKLSSGWDIITGDITVNWERGNGGQIDLTDSITTGSLGGLIELRDEIMTEFYLQLDDFAQGLITEVNRQYSQGVGLNNYTDLTSTYNISNYRAYRTSFPGADNDLQLTALTPGADGEKVGIKFVKATNQAQALEVVATYDAVNDLYNITVTLPVDANGEVIATAEDIVKAINEQRTPGRPYPNPLPTAPPYLAGDLLQAGLASNNKGDQRVEEWINPLDPNGFYYLNDDLQHVLDLGGEITWGYEYAQYETELDGDNNDLVFSVNPDWLNLPANANKTGEEISIQYDSTLAVGTVNVVGDSITVGIDAATTADDIIAYIQADPTARGMVLVERSPENTGLGLVADMGPSYLSRSGSFDLVIYDQEGVPEIHNIVVRPTDNIQDVIQQINSLPHITAGEYTDSGDTYIRIQAENGYEYAFANDTSSALAALGLNTFFDGYDSATISLNDVVVDDPRLINTGRLDEQGLAASGDNSNALDTADIKDKKFDFRTATCTISEAYNTLSADVGATAHTITRNHDFNATLVDQIYGQRDIVSAVSLDEEMSDLMKYQYMYQAAAKMISAVDELLQTLLSIK